MMFFFYLVKTKIKKDYLGLFISSLICSFCFYFFHVIGLGPFRMYFLQSICVLIELN